GLPDRSTFLFAVLGSLLGEPLGPSVAPDCLELGLVSCLYRTRFESALSAVFCFAFSAPIPHNNERSTIANRGASDASCANIPAGSVHSCRKRAGGKPDAGRFQTRSQIGAAP